jgi:DNA-binding response OmpR family regulator
VLELELLVAELRQAVAKALELGADAYITKPFSTRELVAKVREILGG